MDTLHTVMRSLTPETKSRRDHLSVFREFLSHLDRASRTPPRKGTSKKAPSKCARGKPAKRRGKG